MVHDEVPSDMWYHDTLVAFSLAIHFHKYTERMIEKGSFDTIPDGWYWESVFEGGKDITRKKFINPEGHTELQRQIQRVEEGFRTPKPRLKAALIEDQYRAQNGIITQLELEITKQWYEQMLRMMDRALRLHYTLRGWKDLSNVEVDEINDEIKTIIKEIRESIRDRYLFERVVEKRIGLR